MNTIFKVSKFQPSVFFQSQKINKEKIPAGHFEKCLANNKIVNYDVELRTNLVCLFLSAQGLDATHKKKTKTPQNRKRQEAYVRNNP